MCPHKRFIRVGTLLSMRKGSKRAAARSILVKVGTADINLARQEAARRGLSISDSTFYKAIKETGLRKPTGAPEQGAEKPLGGVLSTFEDSLNMESGAAKAVKPQSWRGTMEKRHPKTKEYEEFEEFACLADQILDDYKQDYCYCHMESDICGVHQLRPATYSDWDVGDVREQHYYAGMVAAAYLGIADHKDAKWASGYADTRIGPTGLPVETPRGLTWRDRDKISEFEMIKFYNAKAKST